MSYEHHVVTWNPEDKQGWYQYIIQPDPEQDYNSFFNYYQSILTWLYDSVDGCERHARWSILDNYALQFRFRYERDLIKFVLRWS